MEGENLSSFDGRQPEEEEEDGGDKHKELEQQECDRE